MINYLFLDTETTGLLHQNPRLVQLAALLCNEDGEEMASISMIAKPVGYTIPETAVNIHGITTEYADRVGLPPVLILKTFRMLTLLTNNLVAHNMEFDMKILQMEMRRFNMEKEARAIGNMPTICTMKDRDVIDFCKLPKKRGKGYKWPKLGELYECVTGTDMADAHSAHADVDATKECFFRLKEKGFFGD